MIHLILGNTGSGKTTYSNQLRSETKGIIFSIDQWNKTLFLPDKKATDGLEWFLECIDRSEKIIMQLVEQLQESGTDAILDLGLSKFEHREKFRKFAWERSFEIKLHFLDVPKATRLERVLQRNREKGSSFEFEVSRKDFEFMESWFEKPTEEELQNAIVIRE
ncbi:ATP-binding protein [Zeaxanthinibacter sp. PT1]|uniref:AAA family ATPase n=1 Tax=Zeaxanthinibacter TaxID=561554 RepID=UPI002349B0D8|nr:ATP-binding protein [Zeaxanthinibacter sp. PT1]MDC6350120.1 ATP-binding protein [Zeaxanthinibacter sp. PT1]